MNHLSKRVLDDDDNEQTRQCDNSMNMPTETSSDEMSNSTSDRHKGRGRKSATSLTYLLDNGIATDLAFVQTRIVVVVDIIICVHFDFDQHSFSLFSLKHHLFV